MLRLRQCRLGTPMLPRCRLKPVNKWMKAAEGNLTFCSPSHKMLSHVALHSQKIHA